MRKFYAMFVGAILTSLVVVSSAFATVDPTLESAADDITSYFSSNIVRVVALVISISLVLWMLSLAFRATGAKKKSL